jgi:type I restriction enzyme S subunit
MAGERRYVPASEFCASVRDGTHDSPKPVERGRKLVTSRHLTTGRLDLTDAYLISEEDFDAINKRSKVDRWDVLISMIGTVGEPCLIKEEPDFAIKNIGLFKTKSEVDGKWLYYFLRSKDAQQSIREQSRGTPQQYIPLGALRDFPILVTDDPAEQKAIAAVLGALDDKIDLNRRMNATLEAMARALFQSWFVDFDPVRLRLSYDGQVRPTQENPTGLPAEALAKVGLDPATAALFPDSFQDSPLGPVPKGWKVERFDVHITADRGLSYKGEGLRDDRTGLPMHNLNSVYEGGGYKHEGLKYYAGEYREKHLLEPGDMIVTNTEQGFDHLLIGHAAIVPRCYGPKGIYSHHIYRVRHKPTSPFSPHYLVELFNNRRWHYWISGFSNGTTINMLPMDALEMPMLVVPPLELVKKFTALAEAAHIQVEDNKQQSRTLATLRDTLLPKLLSGELSLENIGVKTKATS